jgi:hypothetical protein
MLLAPLRTPEDFAFLQKASSMQRFQAPPGKTDISISQNARDGNHKIKKLASEQNRAPVPLD